MIACQSEQVNEAKMNPQTSDQKTTSITDVVQKQEKWKETPFASAEKPLLTFNYDSKKGGEYQLETGTFIAVPKNAFKRKDGSQVEGKVSLKYREYHTVDEIILSGINMKYEEGDTTGDFESAGMFEIRAFDGDEELELNEGKTIDIDLASFKSGDFKHYKMNEAANTWEYLEESTAKINPRKQQAPLTPEAEAIKEQLEEICINEPIAFDPENDRIFDIGYDFYRYPELKMFNEAMWKAANPEEEQKIERALRQEYDDMEILPSEDCNTFEFTVWNRTLTGEISNKQTFKIMPVWTGKAFKNAKKDYKKRVKEWEEAVEEISQNRQINEREADLVRSFRLKGMGVFNCDRILEYTKFVIVGLAITCKEKIKNFFHITLNNSAAVKYYNPMDDGFKYIPNSKNSIMAILPDNKVGVATDEMFQNAYEQYRSNPSPDARLELELEIQDKEINTANDFKETYAEL